MTSAGERGHLRDAEAQILDVLASVAAGDLRRRCGPLAGPLAGVAEALDRALEALGRALGPIGAAAHELHAGSEAILRLVRHVATGASRQAAATGEIARRLQSLGARAEEIGQIVELLDDVAAETNILALNAAIEASRAGAEGRGFGMVADEVRKLAERSAAATRDLSAFIQMLESTAGEATRAVDGVRATADAVAGSASETVESAARLAGAARSIDETLAGLRISAAPEAVLEAALADRRGELDRLLGGLGPLLDDPEVARTSLGDALLRLRGAIGPREGR